MCLWLMDDSIQMKIQHKTFFICPHKSFVSKDAMSVSQNHYGKFQSYQKNFKSVIT